MPAIHHPERSRRFKEVGHGDISAWARSTTNAKRLECGGRAVSGPAIKDLDALRTAVTSVPTAVPCHDVDSITIPFDEPDKGGIVANEIRKCERTAVALDATLAICDAMNRRLGLIK